MEGCWCGGSPRGRGLGRGSQPLFGRIPGFWTPRTPGWPPTPTTRSINRDLNTPPPRPAPGHEPQPRQRHLWRLRHRPLGARRQDRGERRGGRFEQQPGRGLVRHDTDRRTPTRAAHTRAHTHSLSLFLSHTYTHTNKHTHTHNQYLSHSLALTHTHLDSPPPTPQGTHTEIDLPGATEALATASSVLIVPGYGLAVANAQHSVAGARGLFFGRGVQGRGSVELHGTPCVWWVVRALGEQQVRLRRVASLFVSGSLCLFVCRCGPAVGNAQHSVAGASFVVGWGRGSVERRKARLAHDGSMVASTNNHSDALRVVCLFVCFRGRFVRVLVLSGALPTAGSFGGRARGSVPRSKARLVSDGLSSA